MSAFYLNRYSFHDVQLEGRRVLFHIPSSGLFELDELGGSLIDFLKENEKITLDGVQQRFDGQAVSAELTQTLDSFRELSIIGDSPGEPDAGMQVEIRQFPLSTVVLNVNTGCNLSCTYCYKEDLAVPTKGVRMDF